jgi:hypothetical protein
MGAFLELSDPEHARRLVNAAERVWGAGRVGGARSEVRHHPTRVIANAGANVAWRNGPVEDIHAGAPWDHPLEKRRVTPDEQRLLMRFAAERMAQVMAACERLTRAASALLGRTGSALRARTDDARHARRGGR